VSSGTPVTLLCCGLLGVTADDGGILERAFTEAFATQGIVPGTAAYARSMVHVHQTRGQSAVDVFRALFPDAPGRAEAATLAFDRSYRLAVDRSGMVPMPGAAEALGQIRGSGIRVCFITGLSRGLLGLVLDTLGWRRQVDFVVCPEDAPRGYPWPDPMLCAMLRLGVTDVRETAYAGGTESGVLCGRRAGAQIVAGILTGGHTRDRLHRAGATHLLGSFAELPEVLAEPVVDPAADPVAGPVAGRTGSAADGSKSSGAKGSDPGPESPRPTGSAGSGSRPGSVPDARPGSSPPAAAPLAPPP
jgi:phosphoglycolate phosphatase